MAGIGDEAALPMRIIEKIKVDIRIVRIGNSFNGMNVAGLKKTEIAFLQHMGPTVDPNFE
jgi:hypothetical protein